MDTSELENTIIEINQMSVEQLNNLERKIDEILKGNHSNEMISILIKLSIRLIEDSHPFIVIKALEILKSI